MFKHVSALAAGVCLAAASLVSAQTAPAAGQPPIVDRELYFGDPEISGAQLSPDGRWLASTTFAPEGTSGEVFLLGASTFIIFAFVLAAALWIARWPQAVFDSAFGSSQ